jgi:hypothetical protein
VTCPPPGRPRQASIDQRESADRIDPTLAAEPTESTDPTDPTEPIDKIDPAEPIDNMDPAEPIDRIDPLEPMLRIDPEEPAERDEPSVFRIRSFSQGPRSRQAMTVIPQAPSDPPYGDIPAAETALMASEGERQRLAGVLRIADAHGDLALQGLRRGGPQRLFRPVHAYYDWLGGHDRPSATLDPARRVSLKPPNGWTP